MSVVVPDLRERASTARAWQGEAESFAFMEAGHVIPRHHRRDIFEV